ncbi:MAG TPA: RtcB family protein [Candidatus Bathyarchaeia archaeon]|nr:RtcB family protein [Candidatus Bathyarchaeia archaeon]
MTFEELLKRDEFIWEVPQDVALGMRVPGRIFISDRLKNYLEQGAIQQVANVATLPGIQKWSLAMPDVHTGYGFPIGGVAAFDVADGVLSPGGVGFDINCGTRLLATTLLKEEIAPRIDELVTALFDAIPSGLGSKGSLRLSEKELDDVFFGGAKWAVNHGYGNPADLKHCESNGCLDGADPAKVSPLAKKRGKPQLGTLGSGNHFLEIQYVDRIFDEKAAHLFGLKEEQICIMLHSGSRGAGHQICSDYLRMFQAASRKYSIGLVDKQLACVPADSHEAREYFSAMAAAANYAWTNRQVMSFWTRDVLERKFNTTATLVYDVAHNIAKLEKHVIDGGRKDVYVHRKGATRAFDQDTSYGIEQPVLIPGSMGTASYVLHGTKKAMSTTFGSTCHGAGRVLSRKAARRSLTWREVTEDLHQKHITIKTEDLAAVPEEAPEAYKPIDEVIDVVSKLGISEAVARLTPVGVIKG